MNTADLPQSTDFRANMTFPSPSLPLCTNRHEMSAIAAEANINTRLLLDRERGEEALPVLRARLDALPEGQPLIVCFNAEQRLDGSFADAAFIDLALEINEGKWGERALLLQGLSVNMVSNIRGVIADRKLKLALLSVEPDGSWECIGNLEDNLRQTLEQIATHDGLGAGELTTIFDLALNTASNRLKKLHDQHLVRRVAHSNEKGLQYLYYFWKWTQ